MSIKLKNMSNNEQEKIKSVCEKGKESPAEGEEKTPESLGQESLENALKGRETEVYKGRDIFCEQGRKNMHVLEAVGAIYPEKKEGKINEKEIMRKTDEAIKAYEKEIEMLQKDIPNVEDKN